MTKLRFTSRRLTASLVAVLLVACAPAKPAVVEPGLPPSSAPVVEATATLEPAANDTLIPSSPAPSADVQPVATSRGPNLEATDPATVSLASGGLQLVEFFRFT